METNHTYHTRNVHLVAFFATQGIFPFTTAPEEGRNVVVFSFANTSELQQTLDAYHDSDTTIKLKSFIAAYQKIRLAMFQNKWRGRS